MFVGKMLLDIANIFRYHKSINLALGLNPKFQLLGIIFPITAIKKSQTVTTRVEFVKKNCRGLVSKSTFC